MNREKIAWMISLVLVAMLAFELPGSLARRDDDYAFVKTLIDLHREVENNYVDPTSEQKLESGSINGMMGELDPYSVYIPAPKEKEFEALLEGSFEGVGIELSQLENGDIQVVTPIPDSPALKAGVMAGDIILKVNGHDIKNEKIADVQKLIKGPLHSPVRLAVRHADGREAELSMTREQITLPTVMGYRRDANGDWDYWVSNDPKIAYLRITQFTSDTYSSLKQAMDQLLGQGMQGLILDLRFNPGGRLDQAKKVVNLFVDSGIIVWTQGQHRAKEVTYADPKETLPRNFPMIVLVNEHSASAAEIVSGSLQDHRRALIVGTRTFGKGSVQEIIPMDEDGGELKLTVAYYYLPSGRKVHKTKGATDWGVDPQVDVPMSEADEQKVLTEQGESAMFRKPLPATRPADGSTAGPTTRPFVDEQLQVALTRMTDAIREHRQDKLADLPPVTQPSTQPATGDE